MSLPAIWAILGVLFLIAELISISFVFAFLGAGALLTALCAWTGLTPTLPGQLLCFALVSVGALALFRKPVRDRFNRRSREGEYSEFVGDAATVIRAIPPDGEGRISYRGTEWIALSESETVIPAGRQVVIRRLDGIRVVVAER